jgi:alkylation response protein AidB-like acyl-CoA dehydrogenase
MKLTLDEKELQIREEVREFLAGNVLRPEDLPGDLDARVAVLRKWQRDVYDAGLVGIAWPKEYGGRGGTASQQLVANLEMARAGAPELIGVIALEVVGPSIVAHGTPEQKRTYVKRMLTGEDIWCQGFSEPEAGSDLASLKTRAEHDGDHFVINGQKTWTSWAKYADWCAVLARTDRDAPAHKGISYLIVDTRAPGVDVRPLKQITGDAEFGEIFFDDVRVPKANLLGELNGGWPLAMHTLTNERGPAVAGRQVKLRITLDRLIDEAHSIQRDGRPAIEDPEILARLTRAHISLEVLRYQSYRSAGAATARGAAGLESSVDKLWLVASEQLLGGTVMDVLGPHLCNPEIRSDNLPAPDRISELQNVYLYSRAASVYGGSEQIQKNIIAQRMLGLPRS